MLYVVDDQSKKAAFFDIGIDYNIVNYAVMILCVIGMIRVVVEIVRVEHKEEYEKRMKGKNSDRNSDIYAKQYPDQKSNTKGKQNNSKAN